MFDRLFGLISYDIGIDLGTANIMMQVLGKGVVVREPSVVARHKKSQTVLAVGHEAKRMVGKAPDSIEVIRPLRDGVIADFDAAEAMLSYYFRLIHEHNPSRFLPMIPRPRVVVGVPSGVTEVEARAVQDAALSAGARQAFLIEEPMAAAIGAGISVEEPEGRMVVDIGGGTTEIAVISLGGIVVNRSVKTAGGELDETIISFIRMKYGLVIGQPSAEEVKISIGSALAGASSVPKKNADNKKVKGVGELVKEAATQAQQEPQNTVVRGRDLGTGLPKSIKLTSSEIREALVPVLRQILNGIMETIEETPPELVSDILEQGIILAGGTSQLRGLDRLIAQETQLPVWVTHDPQMAVVRGAAKALENPKLLERVKMEGGIRV